MFFKFTASIRKVRRFCAAGCDATKCWHSSADLKLGDLAAFTSAIVLAMIALLIGYESVDRLLNPVPIAFNQAIPIAVLGLGVNLVSALVLREDHDHHHDHSYDHSHDHGHQHHSVHRDNNFRAAFVHVTADAAVSVLVIIGL